MNRRWNHLIQPRFLRRSFLMQGLFAVFSALIVIPFSSSDAFSYSALTDVVVAPPDALRDLDQRMATQRIQVAVHFRPGSIETKRKSPEDYAIQLKKLKATKKCPNCDLTGIDLSGLDLSGVDLSGAYLFGVRLSRTNLSGANLIKADLRKANLRGTNLSRAKLNEANLRKANLRGADLSGADLSGADLSGARLKGANLTDADLTDASIKNARMDDAILCHTKLPRGEENRNCK